MSLVLSAFYLSLAATAAESPDTLKAFLGKYCTECHGAEKQKGDRRFDQLTLPVKDADTLFLLQDMIDQLNLGEMPPKKAKAHPSLGEVKPMVEFLTKTVNEARAQFASTGGRTILRRLNKREYINTVGDLCGLNMLMFDPTTRFPRDQTVEHMDNIGDTLRTSGYLLAQYLDAADQVIEKALGMMEKPPTREWTFDRDFRQQPELQYSHGKVYNFRYLCVYEVGNTVNHEGGYGPIHGFEQGVPADGRYEIKVLAHAMNRKHPYDPRIFQMDPEEPFRLGIAPGNVKAGPLHHPQPIQPLLAEVTMRDGEPEWYTMNVWLDKGYTPRFTFPNGMANSRRAFGQILAKYRHLLPEKERDAKGIVLARSTTLEHGHMPHIRIHEVKIRGPIHDEWPLPSHKTILGDQPFSEDRAREIIERFASRAYRRPARPEEVDRLMAVVDSRRKAGKSAFEAMKDGLKAVLCSPAFLYLVEPGSGDGKDLTAYELASRMSYFFWATLPDEELLRAAKSGDLLKEDVLLAQTRRMLADARSEAFVQGFLDSWLNLRSLGDMPPDRDAFERYYYDDLQDAMKRETQLFTRDLINRNGSIVNFLNADYTFANNELAGLYGEKDAINLSRGGEFRKIKLSNPNRGGLLGQGSVLTVSANGIETSPVIRGVWLLENILGTPPSPPPDNVPPIDPDVRGAKSMRDLLVKHRDNPACYECHHKIDPLGFALENFDPIGQWRTNYRKDVSIDASGELPGGQAFQNVADLKQLLVERKDLFARMLTERLLTYACGRRIEPLDRPDVDHIVARIKEDGYGFRDQIEQVVLSKPFRSK